MFRNIDHLLYVLFSAFYVYKRPRKVDKQLPDHIVNQYLYSFTAGQFKADYLSLLYNVLQLDADSPAPRLDARCHLHMLCIFVVKFAVKRACGV